MTSRACLTAMVVLLSVACGYAAPRKDPRLIRISEQELQRLIRQTPIESPQHARLAARAVSSGLQKVAYEQYTALWQRNRANGYANLRRGIAAQEYWRYTGRLGGQRLPPQEEHELFRTARSCLSKAVSLLPDSAAAHVAYGFFIWQWGNQMGPGLNYLRKAARLAPEEARVHANLGSVYSNPSGNAYNPQQAEQALRKAIQLDSSYAYPRRLLASLYLNTKRYKEAQRELQAYLSLAPPGTEKAVVIYQRAINQGLGRQ